MIPSRREFLALLAALGGAATARGEAIPNWQGRAPALPLDGAVTPLAAPVAVGGDAWGPFTRLCMTNDVARPEGGTTPLSDPRCLGLSGTPRPEGGILLRLTFEGMSPPPVFTLVRDAEGGVSDVQLVPDPRLPPVPPAQRARLLRQLGAVFEVLNLGRRTLGQGDGFGLLLPDDMLEGLRPPPGGLPCTVEGEARMEGRPVLVARCEAVVDGAVEPNWGARLEMAGRLAVDVATGLVTAQGFATRMAMRRRQRGVWKSGGDDGDPARRADGDRLNAATPPAPRTGGGCRSGRSRRRRSPP